MPFSVRTRGLMISCSIGTAAPFQTETLSTIERERVIVMRTLRIGLTKVSAMTLLLTFAWFAVLVGGGATFAQSGDTVAKALYGAYGGVGLTPLNPPPDFEAWFAVVVVEIDSRTEVADVTVSNFELLDHAGNATRFKRVVVIEEFERSRSDDEGECAYWLGSDGTRPWNGTLPTGKIRLRVRVALAEDPPREVFRSQGDSRVTFRLTLGRHLVDGPIECRWPT